MMAEPAQIEPWRKAWRDDVSKVLQPGHIRAIQAALQGGDGDRLARLLPTKEQMAMLHEWRSGHLGTFLKWVLSTPTHEIARELIPEIERCFAEGRNDAQA